MEEKNLATGKKVLVMYDVRGIQNYIFRTQKLKDAIGASHLVDGIIRTTLADAVRALCIQHAKLSWYDESSGLPYRYTDDDSDICVLYIGGGNANVIMKEELALPISKWMSKQIIERTYSLQLAVAVVPKTGNYARDYDSLNKEMMRVKASMVLTKPVGAFPVMRVEVKTGYPAVSVEETNGKVISRESVFKKVAADRARDGMKENEKKMESYITEKYVDSTIAIVHIDGNNLGLRIRSLIEGIDDYADAVTKMRGISLSINLGFKEAFEKTKKYVDERASAAKEFKNKKDSLFLVKIINAGDDLTFVCNGQLAVSAVEFFAKEVSKHTLLDKDIFKKTGTMTEKDKITKFGFSVCAGIAYAGSHFPFSIGYDAAEACCDEAKTVAKRPENMENDRIGNWMDFTFCKNIQSRNVSNVRKYEYETGEGEKLLLRPYFIPVQDYPEGSVFKKAAKSDHSLSKLKQNLEYFKKTEEEQEKNGATRSQLKEFRNTYPLGQGQVSMLMNFLQSRGRTLPNGDAYVEETDTRGKNVRIARYYDALELMDMYINLEDIETKTKEGGTKG